MNDPKYQYGSDDCIIHREHGYTVSPNEPVFTIRGKDPIAIQVISHYVHLCQVMRHLASNNGDHKLAAHFHEHTVSAHERLSAVMEYQETHPEIIGPCITG